MKKNGKIKSVFSSSENYDHWTYLSSKYRVRHYFFKLKHILIKWNICLPGIFIQIARKPNMPQCQYSKLGREACKMLLTRQQLIRRKFFFAPTRTLLKAQMSEATSFWYSFLKGLAGLQEKQFSPYPLTYHCDFLGSRPKIRKTKVE